MSTLVDKTVNAIATKNYKVQYLDNVVDQFKLGDGRVDNLAIPLFDFNVTANKLSNGDNILTTMFKNITGNKIAQESKVPFSHFKVESTKPIQIEKAFGDNVIQKEVEPFHHKNPQKYEYHLNKYDVKDIAMKRLEIEGGGTNEYSRIENDFYNQYLRSMNSSYQNDDPISYPLHGETFHQYRDRNPHISSNQQVDRYMRNERFNQFKRNSEERQFRGQIYAALDAQQKRPPPSIHFKSHSIRNIKPFAKAPPPQNIPIESIQNITPFTPYNHDEAPATAPKYNAATKIQKIARKKLIGRN
jgi:hypothetical protein